jgi:ketosteroid isomerase-like protein
MAQHTAAGSDPATMAERDADVQEFLNQFSRSLTAGDGHTIARMWAVPALVLGDDMAMVVNTPAEVEKFFSGAKDEYNKRGITDTHADITTLHWVTEKIAIVAVRWPYLDAQGKEVGAEASTYTLRRDERGELKLQAAVMHGIEGQ